MTKRQRVFSILIGVPGAAASVLALSGFMLRVLRNQLPVPQAPTRQAFYQMVGKAYSGGFLHGFSLCFFLVLLAVAVSSWVEQRRAAAARISPGFRT